MDIDYLKILVTIVLAVLGWIVAHYFTTTRNRITKRREITIEHLIIAYRILANEISQRQSNPESIRKLESILTDIQLFGALEQVDLAKKLAKDVSDNEQFELDLLINSLRNDLRSQLGLKKVQGNVVWLRHK